MASLLDIAPAVEAVEVRGVSLEVKGIDAEAIASLLERFGNIFEVFSGTVGASGIAKGLQPAIAAVIAAATGLLANKDAEKAASGLPVADQVKILAAVRRLTMPNGPRPFLQDLSELGLLPREVVANLDQAVAAASNETSAEPSKS